MSFFARLDPQTQDRLLASYMHVELADLPRAKLQNGDSAYRLFSNDGFALVRACFSNETSVVEGMLAAGVCVDRQSISLHDRAPTNPLSWCAYGIKSHPNRLDTTATLDLLLDRGADPNCITNHAAREVLHCPMYAASDVPVALERLIARGGNVNLHSDSGWGLLDQWMWSCFSASKKEKIDAMRALDLMLAAGLDLHRPMFDGTSFLVDCWGSTSLRPLIPELIARGFDPYAKGTGKGLRAHSLLDHLEKKAKSGKGGALAQQLVAQFAAQALEEKTTPATSVAAKPRL